MSRDTARTIACATIGEGAFALLAMGIRNMSRIAAAGALGLHLLERLTLLGWQFGVAGQSMFVLIAVTMAFISGVRGTFAYHKMREARNPLAG